MSVQSKEEGDVLIVNITDARILDEGRIQEIASQLFALISKCPKGRMLLSFKKVEFMSSAMIGKIIALNNKCRDADVDLRLCEISPEILKVFKMFKLPKMINIQRTEEKALASFDKKGIFS